ncbi:porin [Marinobacter pelagius]|uniref:porin n=1 Tax=Marinobacter sp. C7 TaxID=2951363 RepID=UPI001EF09502|nr:porin [Marinobacter sp. C7]MCG7201378.1 porin [Marinobacter sp. C7]
MKKTLIASAIAAATFSGAVAAQESNMPTVYGNIQYVVYHADVKGGENGLEHADNGSTLGVKHDHEIAPGITGFFKLELEGLAADDKDRETGLEDVDEAYIGVKGDSFGQVWVGSDDSTYESAIDKIANFYEFAAYNFGGGYETGEGDLVQYMTPSFGGLTLGAAVQINGDLDDATLPDKSGEKSYPYQLAATYAVDNLELAVAMDSNDGAGGPNNENTYGVRATFDMDALSLTGQYQTRKDVGDRYGVHAVYAMGANQFAASYELDVADDANDTERDTLTLQALHNLSDHMYVYVEGYLGNGDDGVYGVANESERSAVAVGGVYYF